MADTVADRPGDAQTWNPGKFALWSERWGDAVRGPISIQLRHPTAPFQRTIDRIDDSAMQALAGDYLDAVMKHPDIDPPIELPQVLAPGSEQLHLFESGFFLWLPLGWPLATPYDKAAISEPFVSFRVERQSAGGDRVLDQTIILLASEWLPPNYLGSGFGIRVVAHARLDDEKYQIRITGMTASLPFGAYSTPHAFELARDHQFDSMFELSSRDRVKTEMFRKLGLKDQSISIRGVRIAASDGAPRVEWHGTSKPDTDGGRVKATPYSFVFSGTPTEAGTLVSRVELVADAVPGNAWMFPLDPASQQDPPHLRERRPTRPATVLDHYRDDEKITAGQLDPLIYSDPSGLPEDSRVMVCPGFVLADDAANVADAKKVDLPDTPNSPSIRSNGFAAISAYNNVRQFFHRLEAYYGANAAASYFRIAGLPLKLFYRSGVRPGPGKDGQTVNARVLPEGWGADYVGPTRLGEHPILQMHLALGDLSTRARKPWDGSKRSQAEPLGIAADARWIWHEIGHVLLMCSVGELEFRFAHSAGDALAAIVSDPQSHLAGDANWRGATFPWVFTPRRHDRCVSHGWGWGGALHFDLAQVPESTHPRRKGYWTEQILSSSLFRLYRAIGGDTRMVGTPNEPDRPARESASHYCVYLIMRGIQLLPTSTVVLTNEPDQLVSALIDADIGTEVWDVTFPAPAPAAPFLFDRVGGCVHKVIRWAFEAQGLYAMAGAVTSAPGLPPPVDIYIQDRRPLSETTPYGSIPYGPGSYIPVSLDWDPLQSGSDARPLWQADQSAIVVTGGNNVSVSVGNRGSEPAVNVAVSVWWCAWPANAPSPPEWGDPQMPWTPCDPQPSAALNIDPALPATFEFTFDPPPTGTRYLVLAQASCADDRANTDPAAALPCSQLPTKLIDLVPNDNNLGLIVVGHP